MPEASKVIEKPGERTQIISPDTWRGGGDPAARTPPGQTLTRKWPVLHYGSVPKIRPEDWQLRVWGLCENPYTLSWQQLMDLPQVDLICDIHCVTQWSRLDNTFTGVSIRTLVEMAKPKPEATFVMQHGASAPNSDWTTNLPIDEFADDDCILATHHEGQPISADHGAPVRAVVPKLYFWKGAKWISGIEFRAADAPGFWEINGYHMHGDPWTEERFGW
ncbi:MAG: sulfite oxidase-like oxidoreductase [Planctomycetes bacterium]|nr:sulfite oxidase-like oxidoreductase [Planctomycetota bacterium]NOG53918.1 sulfite oxidase-like oxidoreductase [Planctomycetota bacterium]